MKKEIKEKESTPTAKALVHSELNLGRAKQILAYAEKLWYETWRNQGATDEGTCCGGKKIETAYGDIHCNFVQGNVSASRASGAVMQYLKTVWGIDSDYNDGWMD